MHFLCISQHKNDGTLLRESLYNTIAIFRVRLPICWHYEFFKQYLTRQILHIEKVLYLAQDTRLVLYLLFILQKNSTLTNGPPCPYARLPASMPAITNFFVLFIEYKYKSHNCALYITFSICT